MSDEDDDPRTEAERRLDEHLELLRSEQGSTDLALAHRIVATARWQRALRAPVTALASVVGAVADGLAGLLGGRRRRTP